MGHPATHIAIPANAIGWKVSRSGSLCTHASALRNLMQTLRTTDPDYVGVPNSINPTSWNFAVTMSLSKGFMMYSLAPA